MRLSALNEATEMYNMTQGKIIKKGRQSDKEPRLQAEMENKIMANWACLQHAKLFKFPLRCQERIRGLALIRNGQWVDQDLSVDLRLGHGRSSNVNHLEATGLLVQCFPALGGGVGGSI